MYLLRNGLENRALSYLFSSIVFILCTESTIPTAAPVPKDNEPKARLWGGIVGFTICVGMFLIFFAYFYPKTASHHRLHGVDEDQVHRHQLDYFLHTSHEHEIKMDRPEHHDTKAKCVEPDSPDVELRDFDKDHHRRVDLNQEEAPEPLCEALR